MTVVVALGLTPGALVVILLRGPDFVREGLRRIVMSACRAAVLAAMGYSRADRDTGDAGRDGDMRAMVTATAIAASMSATDTGGRIGVSGPTARMRATCRAMEAATSRRRAYMGRWRTTAVEAATAAPAMRRATTGVRGAAATAVRGAAAVRCSTTAAAAMMLLSERAGPAKQGQGACRR